MSDDYCKFSTVSGSTYCLCLIQPIFCFLFILLILFNRHKINDYLSNQRWHQCDWVYVILCLNQFGILLFDPPQPLSLAPSPLASFLNKLNGNRVSIDFLSIIYCISLLILLIVIYNICLSNCVKDGMKYELFAFIPRTICNIYISFEMLNKKALQDFNDIYQ